MTAATTVHSLAYWRRNALLSQRTLAERANVNVGTIFLIETGRSPSPRLDTIRKLCAVLGVDWRSVSEFVAAMEQEWTGRG